MGARPIHKTQGFRPALLIGPVGRGRVPRVERALGPGEWEDPRLGGARGVPWLSQQDFLFPLPCSFSPPRVGNGTSHPRIPAPSPLPSSGAAAILARQVEVPWLCGVRTGSPSRGRRRDPPSPPPLPAPAQSFEARGGRPGFSQARGGGAGGVAAASPGPVVPPRVGGEVLVTAGRRHSSGAGCRAGRPAPWGRGGEGGAWGGRNHRGGVGR